MDMAARTGAWSGKSLPYDAEVEWIRGDGQSFIDTGIKASSFLVVKAKVLNRFSASGWANLISGGDRWLSGMFQLSLGDKHDCQLAFNTKQSNDAAWRDTPYFPVNIEIRRNEVFINDSMLTSTTYSQFSSNYNIFIFATNRANVVSEITGYIAIENLSITEDDTLVRDFIPVRQGQEGMLYDKVSGQLFRNAGAGAFIIGPDKT